jgi:predicted  nucleic acid-binding Zn-ribbon protein
MENVLETLKTLQNVLTERIDLELKIQEIPKLLTTQEELLARMKKSYIEKSMDYEKAKIAEAEYRNSLFEAESRREKAEKNMESISTQREYEALDKEIEDAAGKEQEFRNKLQREVRVISDLDEEMKQNQALIEQQEEELENRRRDIETDVFTKEAQMKALSEQENNLATELDDPDVLFKFERIIRNKMGRGIVAIKGGVCMGCHMILPAQFVNVVRQGEEIVFCPYCSRILFYEESEQGEEDFFFEDDSGILSDLDDIDDDFYDDDDDDEEEEKINIDFEE